MSIVRDGLASSSRSNSSSSIFVALRENTLKLTPPGRTLAPIGELIPAASGTLAVRGACGVGRVAAVDVVAVVMVLLLRGECRQSVPPVISPSGEVPLAMLF